MEVALLGACLNTLLPRLWDKRKAESKDRCIIEVNVDAINIGINRLEDALGNAKFNGDGSTGRSLKREARELCQGTRDCIQRFFKDKKASCTDFATMTEAKSQAIQELSGRIEAHSSQEKASQKPSEPYVADPMGMEEPVKEVMKLVELPGRPLDGRRKVISIVGFPGLGKTILAKLVYHKDRTDREQEAKQSSPATTDCTLRARVTAAAKDTEAILRDVLQQVGTEGNHGKLNLEELGELLEQSLRGKRYFIVIDDMQSIEQWDGMKEAFPKNTDGDKDGTIIVTTTIQPVANVCSSCNGYVYKLSPLDKDNALALFLKDINKFVDDASDILNSCDGLPLAIVSMSQYLKGSGVPKTSRYLLEDGPYLKRLRWVLMNKYTGLTGDAIRSCLLYYCLYKDKMDAVPSRNSLIRRWDAEGFLAKLGCNRPMDVAAEILKTFVDCNIMQSMEVGTNGSTRRCRPPGIMVEYISQISMFENFAALVSDELPRGTRRLSFHAGNITDGNIISGMNLRNVLTLAVSGIGCKSILDFKNYELLGVLDLKECTNLKEGHVIDICKLLLLKYLSLGKTIETIPSEMEKLELLETLEMRTNKTVFVYAEILKLPNLKHLLGKFELMHKPVKDLESGLETVTAFVSKRVDGGFPFPQLMQHMKRLRKVKIYCSPTASETDQQDLQREIKAFTSQSTNLVMCNRSLSIDFAEFIGESRPSPLDFLKQSGSLNSLKLRGVWGHLLFHEENRIVRAIPDFRKLSGVRKMCLSRTCLSGKEVVDRLTNLIALEYLKLDESELGPLVITAGTLQRLKRLCLVGQAKLHGIRIEQEAVPNLVSLHLICKALDLGLESSIGIRGVQGLNEIALDSEVDKDVKGAWKTAAKGHPNRPQVLLIKKGTPIRQA